MPEEVSGSGFPSPELAVSNVGDVCWQLPEDWGSLFFGIQPDCLNVTFLVLKFCLHFSSFHTHSMMLCCQSQVVHGKNDVVKIFHHFVCILSISTFFCCFCYFLLF